MKIALVAEDYGCGRYVGGIARYTRTIAEAMAGRGHSVVIFGCGDQPDAPPGVRYRRVARWAATGWFWRKVYYRLIRPLFPGWAFSLEWGIPLALALRKASRQGEIDIVEGPETGGFLLTAQLVVGRGVPMVVRMHAPSAVTARDARAGERRHLSQLSGLEAASIRRAHAITAPTRAVVALAHEAMGTSLERPSIIPNPAPPARVDHAGEPAQASERVVFVGRLEPLKGFDVLVRAFADVLRERPTARLVIIGPDSLSLLANGLLPYLESLMPREDAERVASRTEWLGAMPPDETEIHRAHSACVAIPSRYENLPYALLEPMSQGCPVIASDCGGITEVLAGTGAGTLVPPGDPAAIARAIVTLLADPSRAGEMGRAARKLIDSRYSPDAVADRTLDLYDRVLREHNAGVRVSALVAGESA